MQHEPVSGSTARPRDWASPVCPGLISFKTRVDPRPKLSWADLSEPTKSKGVARVGGVDEVVVGGFAPQRYMVRRLSQIFGFLLPQFAAQ